MKRGEVWWVDFLPSVGGEIRKKRPAVILSNDLSNKHLDRVQVVPLTSRVEVLYPSEAYVRLKGRQSKAMADQLATVSKSRLSGPLCRITRDDLRKVEQAVLLQLGIVVEATVKQEPLQS
jgi:mRNA interferase MazF